MKSKRPVLITLALVLTVGISLGWFHYRNLHPSTNDAYIGANTVTISPEIDGKVAQVLVHSYQQVKKGDVLFRIDDRNYRLAVEQAKARVVVARAQAKSAQAETRASRAQARATRQQQADLALNNRRLQQLANTGFIPQQQADDTRYKLKQASADAAAAESTIASVRAHIDASNAALQTARLAVAQAQLDMSHTVITAPADGIVGEVNIRSGDFVSTGEKLFPIIETGAYWVDANYKETDLDRIHVGQRASIDLDMHPDQHYTGVVESLSPASGVSFSLIPPQNATGNWVKVTQRFPVRIKILPDKDTPAPLLGASASVSVDTTRTPEKVAEDQPQQNDTGRG